MTEYPGFAILKENIIPSFRVGDREMDVQIRLYHLFNRVRKAILWGSVLVLLLTGGVGETAVVHAVADAESLNKCGILNRTLSVDPSGRSEGYSVVLYDNTNGLPTSEANAIAETREGFIWIGSYSGLIRYDGDSFVRMNSTMGIASVISLYVDKKDRLWIGTNDAGLALMERGKYRRWGETEGLKSLRVSSVAEDERGTIYVATAVGIAMIGKDMKLSYLDDPRIDEAYISSMRMGNDGLICGTTVSSDVFFIRDGELIDWLDHEKSGLKGISYALPDPRDPQKMYFGADDSTIYYGSMEDEFKRMKSWDISPLYNVTSMEYIDGQIWICAENGIGVLDENDFHCMQNLPINNSVETLITDYEGNLWFASSRQGVMKIVPNQFSNLFDRYELPKDVVNSTCMYGDQLFMGTDSGLKVLDKNGQVEAIPLTKAETASGVKLEETDLIRMLDGKRIRSIVRDSKGRLWISTWKSVGLLRYDHGNLVTFNEEDGLLSGRVRIVHERKDGTMLAAITGGVSVISGDEVIASYGKEAGIINTESLTVTEGFHGEIVLGSNGNGIYVITDAGTQNIAIKDGLTSGIIMRIKRDEKRKVYWIVTSNSLAYMTDDYKVHTIQKFPYSNNFDLYENSKGDMWVLSSNGIYVVRAEELLTNGEISPVYYGMGNGLMGIATANSYSELTQDGDLYIAASTGVIKVNIETSFENVGELKAAVPFIDVDGERIYPDDNGIFTIPSDAQKLTISSFVFNYSLVDPQVSYQLEGFEGERAPVNRSEMVSVDYTNLPGGVYNFVMRLKDSMGRGGKEVSVRIVKEKAFYEQTWFFVVAGVVILCLLWVGVLLYIRKKTRDFEKKQQQAREQFEQTAEALANAIDAKDPYTNGHSRRVAEYSLKIAQAVGKSAEECEKTYFAALLHDVGKIGIPDSIINKNGRLTEDEFEQIKQHPVKGGQILSTIKQSPWLSVGARYHHERYGGGGYPEGLKGEAIPEIARIIAVADAYDAMTSNRSYRNAIPQHIVREEIVKGMGTQFDPVFAKAMLHMIDIDTEYRMQEKETGSAITPATSIRCDTIYHDCSAGVVVTKKTARIRLCSQPDEGFRKEESLPWLILYDSLDGMVHPGEENNKNLLYFEYARIRLDGEVVQGGVRKVDVQSGDQETDLEATAFGEPERGQHYKIEAVRYRDHALVRIADEKRTIRIILALPDSSRFVYIAVGGEHCYIHNIGIENDEVEIGAEAIPRIAEEISFIKGAPSGDVPNIQVDSWRSETTRGIRITENMKLSFHTLSLPTARLVWHCPFISVFSSDDGQVNGRAFREYMLLRLDGENWESDEHVKNEVKVVRQESFAGWNDWKEKNKQGIDCQVIIQREKNCIIMQTENLGISIQSVTTISDDPKEIYVALTGDQCVITNIRIEPLA